MRRSGSPFNGVAAVSIKEAADSMMNARFHLIMLLILLTALGAIYGAIGQITATTAEEEFLFLKLLTTARDPLPSFVDFLSFLLPLVAIALGFDAINGEYSRRTMSRLLAQPIYRDAVIFGKFLGNMLVITIGLLTLWLLMIGLGILSLGLPPSLADIIRGGVFLAITVAYTGVWLAIAIVLSILIRSPATSALAALSTWLVLSVFWGMLTRMIAGAFSPIDRLDPMSVVGQFETQQAIARLSPQALYGEATTILLDPSARSVGPLFLDQVQGAIIGAPIATLQSILIVWPQITGLISAMILLFAFGYVAFQRQEVRA